MGSQVEGYQQSPFPHFIPLKLLQAHPRVEKVLVLRKGKCFENYKKVQRTMSLTGSLLSTIILPKESHYFNNCSTRTVRILQKAHCIMPPQRMHKHTHRTQSATALTSESSSSLPLIPAKHLLSLQASQAT